MPSYLGASVRLATSDLDKTITQGNALRNSQLLTDNVKKIERGFAAESTTLLQELSVPGDDGCSLRFLGEHQDMPFFLVRAGKDLFQSIRKHPFNQPQPKPVRLRLLPPSRPSIEPVGGEQEGSSSELSSVTSQESAITSPEGVSSAPASLHESGPGQPCEDVAISNSEAGAKANCEPKALSLNITLNKDCFLSRPTSLLDEPSVLNVKIDVFLNGELCMSTYTQLRKQKDCPKVGLKERFSGRRVARLFERPWILVPPGRNIDGSPTAIDPTEEASIGASQRWKAINDQLHFVAEGLDKDKYGRRTELASYLLSLANVGMPKDFPVPACRKFGVMDVVMTAGSGMKEGPGSYYLTNPELMQSSNMLLRSVQHNKPVGNRSARNTKKRSYTEMVGQHDRMGQPPDTPATSQNEASPRTQVTHQTTSNAHAIPGTPQNSIVTRSGSQRGRTIVTPNTGVAGGRQLARPRFVPQKRYKGSEPCTRGKL